MMKKILLFSLMLVLCGPAFAGKPALTEPGYTAMLFHKLGGKAPNFDSWAQKTGEDAQSLKNTYSLLTFKDPLVVEIPVRLSPYSAASQGFFIGNFRQETFFPVRYGGQSYAIVPLGIVDRQWMKVPDEKTARLIEDAARGGAPLTMLLMLDPKYADVSTPADIGGENYWLMSTEVRKMALYAPGAPEPLWQSDPAQEDLKHQELLKLRQ